MQRFHSTPVVLILLIALAHEVHADQWTRFRGPNGSGLAEASSIPSRWSESNIHWQVDLPGAGHSSPVAWQEKLFLTSGDESSGKRIVTCLQTSDGSRLWQREFPAAHHRKHQLNSFASPTPAVDEQRVYVCWGTPDETIVLALDHAGRDAWRVDLGEFKSGHGFGVSPILLDDLLVLALEHHGDSRWIALDRSTGKTRWTKAIDSKSHYATPCVRTVGDRRELIFTNWEQGICGVDPATGEILWSGDVFDKSHVESSISSPVLAGDLVLGVCGWLGHKYEVAAVKPGPSSHEAELVWKLDRGAPLCVTPLVKDDLLFLWSDSGIVTCVDVASGKVHWQRRLGGNYYSSPICLGDRLCNVSVDGEVVFLAAAKEYEVLGRNELDEGSHSTPAVVDGTLVIRTFSKVFALRGDAR